MRISQCKRRLLILSKALPSCDFIWSRLCSNERSEEISILSRLCAERFYIHSGDLLGGARCYGALGSELRRNLLEQWWSSVVRSRAQVFAITSPLYETTSKGPVRLVNIKKIRETQGLTPEDATQKMRAVVEDAASIRDCLLRGALQQFVQALELVNRRLPFGLAEIGVRHECEGPTQHSAASSAVTESSMVWFCSPRTSSQWMDYWARQRLQWWRKFALGPSDFRMCNLEREDGAFHGVQILFDFPWGSKSLETLQCLGDMELLKTHPGSKLQCRDGRKTVVPHVISVSGNMDLGLLAYLFNSFQVMKKSQDNEKLLQRTVLKLHPALTPVKVALDMGLGSNVELRQVCEGLLLEFLEAGIFTWPGYLDTVPLSLRSLQTKYDEMGVLFTVMVSENTLKSGLLLIRSRDTTIRETMHVSQLKAFLLKYLSASEE